MVLTVVMVVMAQSGCTKDTDCKGDRICEAGSCVAPPAAATLAPPPPPAPELAPESYPRVVHRDGQVCVQSLGPTGLVEESCRAERKPLGGASAASAEDTPPPRRREAEEARGGFCADVLLNGGLMALFAGSSTAALPQVTGYVALGGRGASGTGFVGVLNASVGFVSFGSVLAIGIAPGLRLGKASHAVFSLGATLLTGGVGGQSFTGVMGSAIIQSVISLFRGFVLTPQVGFHLDASGVLLTLGIGFGFSTL